MRAPPPRRARRAAPELRDAWADLLHGGRCAACSRPGRALCERCAAALPRAGFPVVPDPCPAGLVACHAAAPYADPLKAVLLAHKEHAAWALAAPLGEVLAAVVRSIAPSGPVVLVPVPSRGATVRSRGHDPLARLVRAAAGRMRDAGAPVAVVPALRLRLQIADQAGLTSLGRAANLADAMALTSGGRRLLGRLPASMLTSGVVICDDVLTTGATAREAQRALQEAGVPVRAIACLAATRRRRPPGLPAALPVCGSDH